MNNEWLMIRPITNDSYEWLVPNQLVQNGSWSDLEKLLNSYRVVLLIPTDDVLLTQVKIPPTNLVRKRLAIPFALEEQLLAPIEELQFAIPARHDQVPLPVAVVTKAKLREYLVPFEQANLSCAGMTADIFALPYFVNSWSIFIQDANAWIRTGEYSGFTIDSEHLLEWLHRALEEITPEKWPAEIVCCCSDPNNATAQSLSDLSIPIQQKVSEGGLLSLVTQPNFDLPINLLQEKFQPVIQQNPTRKRWYCVLGLAGLWMILLSTHLITKYYTLSHEQKTLETNVTSLYQQVYPNATSIVSPKIRLTRTLQELQSQGNNNSFLNLFATIANTVRQIPDVTITNISFRANAMDLTLQAKNFDALGQAKKQLSSTGLNVSQEYAASQENIINARLRIKGENPA
jgi:general secretion pathway protein L